jgi:hypothetical protein
MEQLVGKVLLRPMSTTKKALQMQNLVGSLFATHSLIGGAA